MQTGTNKVEPTGTAQSTFMPSTMNAARIHGRGGQEFLKYEDAPSRNWSPATRSCAHATGITPTELGPADAQRAGQGDFFQTLASGRSIALHVEGALGARQEPAVRTLGIEPWAGLHT